MKTTLTDILDNCTPEELDGALCDVPLPLSDSALLERIQKRAIESAGIARPVKKQTRFKKALLVAAAIIAVAAVLVGCYVADVTEYNRAIGFFELNSFSTEGLTRGEIKRVYRDITTESLNYDKSYEVIGKNNSADSVAGMDIRIMNNSYANNALADRYWDNSEEIPDRGTTYEYDTDYGDDQYLYDSEGYTFGCSVYKSTRLSKYVDGEKQWTATFEGFGIKGYVVHENMVLVYGSTTYLYGEEPQFSHIALINDADGAVLWQTQLDSQDNSDIVGGAVYHGGGFTLFSLADNTMAGGIAHYYDKERDNRTYLTVRTVGLDGKVALQNRFELENAGWIGQLTALDGGYFAEIGYYGFNYAFRSYFIRIGADGSLLNTYRYDSDDTQYEIKDVFAHDGTVYISAEARPTESHLYDDLNWEAWQEGDGENPFSRYDDDLLEAARKEFSSVLFVCDPDKGGPELFYSVGGTLPGRLSTDEEGCLRWDVKRIIKCGCSPFTSSFSLYGLTREYDYTFDYDNNLLRQEKTDLIDLFRTH